jgi:hypothetical protein
MVNYNNSKIYKIEPINGEEGDIYIGSTTKHLLSERMAKHRINYKNWKEDKYGKTTNFILFDKYGVDNCIISLIENFNCNSLTELRIRETFYINLMLCVNERIPYRSDEDKKKNIKIYRDNNSVEITKKSKIYRDNNKDIIKIKYKEFRDNNKEKEAERHSIYYQNNKYEIAKKSKEFHELNKDRINMTTNIKRLIKSQCKCGSIFSECRKQEHERTKKHVNFYINNNLI